MDKEILVEDKQSEEIEGYLRIDSGYEHGPTLEFSEDRENWRELYDILGVKWSDDPDPRKWCISWEIIGDIRIIRKDSSISKDR